jgi:hypothetical protein
MRIAVMQPYILPYPGYFQLIASVDVFVVYDAIKYTKKGWINRNRFLLNGKAEVFSIPLAKSPDDFAINEKTIAADFDGRSILRRFEAAYARAPQFAHAQELAEKCVVQGEKNLFRYLYHSIREVCAYLRIPTKIVVSSTVESHPEKRGQERVISLCRDLGATTYINPIGGQALYSATAFRSRGIELNFLRPRIESYRQFQEPFTPGLSVLDMLMFVPQEAAGEAAKSYEVTGPEPHDQDG